jgi:hypothetical protein
MLNILTFFKFEGPYRPTLPKVKNRTYGLGRAQEFRDPEKIFRTY